MKIRIILSILTTILYKVSLYLYALSYSPITGAATAAQLNDTTSSYLTAKAIRDGTVQDIALYAMLGILCLIWLPVLFPSRKQKTKLHEKTTHHRNAVAGIVTHRLSQTS